MKQRGRKSAAEISTFVIDAGRTMPPPPPVELTDPQAAVWRDAVASMPGAWLTRAAHPVLVEFCRHTCRARFLESLVAKFDRDWVAVDGGVERLDRLLAMAERETRALTACARALRITPQAQMHARTAGRRADVAPQGKRPWDP